MSSKAADWPASMRNEPMACPCIEDDWANLQIADTDWSKSGIISCCPLHSFSLPPVFLVLFLECVCVQACVPLCVWCTHTRTLAVSVCGWYPCNFAHWHHGFTLLPACSVWECIDTCAHGSKCTWVPRVDSKNYPLSLLYLIHWPGFLIKPRAHNMVSNASLLALEKLSLSSEATVTGGSLYPPSIYMGVEIQTLSLHLCGKHFNPWAIC